MFPYTPAVESNARRHDSLKATLLTAAHRLTLRRNMLSRERRGETPETRSDESGVKDLKKDMDAELAELKDLVKDAQQKAAKTVAERPLLALGVAFVVGMAIGIALSKSSD